MFPLIGANSPKGYQVSNSIRGDVEGRPRLVREQDAPTLGTKFTVSFWFKPIHYLTVASQDSRVGQQIFGSLDGNNASAGYIHYSDAGSGQFDYADTVSGTNANINWSRLWLDVHAWHHVVLAVDTTQGTDTNRVKLYINGVQETATDSATWYDQNQVTSFGVDGNDHIWMDATLGGTAWYEDQAMSGYFCEAAFVDGLAYAPSKFGVAEAESGIWVPINPLSSNITWGNNGFLLQFKQSGTGTASATTVGADTSGNTNHFTSTSVTVGAHITEDTCTNNFCTLNTSNKSTGSILKHGNTEHVNTANDQGSVGTLGFRSGKWYWEVALVKQIEAGISVDSDYVQLNNDGTVGSNDANVGGTGGVLLITNSAGGSNDFRFNGATTSESTDISYSDGQNLQVAVDADNGKIYFGKDGSFQVNGNPAGNANETKDFSSLTSEIIIPLFTIGTGSSASFKVNFGCPAHDISTGHTDGNGFGNFEFAVPDGFFALCTQNLARYGG